VRVHTICPLLLIVTAPLIAQTKIGGGACNSSSLNGAYTFTLSGRQVATSGAFTGVFQANGSATFDGTNKATLTMNSATVQSAGTPLIYSGTYSVQSNCAGAVNISAGNSVTFNLLIYNQGKSFLITGTDASYVYSGGGSNQPTTCMASLLSGVYVFSSTGFTLTSGAINGALAAGGLLQFDGKNALTVNFTYVSRGQSPMVLALSGTYSISGGCSGTGTLTDLLGNSYSLAFAVSGGSAVSTTAIDMILSQTNKLLFTGSAHAVYGQPTASIQLQSGGQA
jgi:hypothetical protein